MSELLEVQEKLLDTTAIIARLESQLVEKPGLQSLIANIRSLKRRQEKLEADFLQATDRVGIDVCSYRLFAEQETPRLQAVSGVLGKFQTLVSLVYDVIKSGLPKHRARVSPDAAAETAFGLGYSFVGSVGMVLTIPRERFLEGFESNLDETIRVIFDLATAKEPAQITNYAKRLGAGPIRELYQWASQHVAWGLGADIEWRRNRDVRASLLVQQLELHQLQEVIDKTSDEVEEEFVIAGQLIAANVESRTFTMRLPDGSEIRGRFADAINEAHTVELPIRYEATIRKLSKVKYSTEEEATAYSLLALRKLD